MTEWQLHRPDEEEWLLSGRRRGTATGKVLGAGSDSGSEFTLHGARREPTLGLNDLRRAWPRSSL